MLFVFLFRFLFLFMWFTQNNRIEEDEEQPVFHAMKKNKIILSIFLSFNK
jgi:hypothetical protein